MSARAVTIAAKLWRKRICSLRETIGEEHENLRRRIPGELLGVEESACPVGAALVGAITGPGDGSDENNNTVAQTTYTVATAGGEVKGEEVAPSTQALITSTYAGVTGFMPNTMFESLLNTVTPSCAEPPTLTIASKPATKDLIAVRTPVWPLCGLSLQKACSDSELSSMSTTFTEHSASNVGLGRRQHVGQPLQPRTPGAVAVAFTMQHPSPAQHVCPARQLGPHTAAVLHSGGLEKASAETSSVVTKSRPCCSVVRENAKKLGSCHWLTLL
jgi:hypothetical protein